MILAVFIIAVAFGAETEFQVFPVPLCPAADGAFVFGNRSVPVHLAMMDRLLELLLSADLLRPEPSHAS